MHPALSSFLASKLIDRRGGYRSIVRDGYEQRVRFDFYSNSLRDEFRRAALAELLEHARRHVPRIRAMLSGRAKVTPESALDLLAHLPPMRRADIQADPVAYHAENSTDAIDDFTGGSTGTPLTFKVDRATQQAREASLMWANSLAGWRPGDRIAMLWGSDRDTKSALRDWRLNLRWWIDNMRWYNAFNMGEGQMAAFHRAMTRFRPHLLVAYAGSLDLYARYHSQLPQSPNYPITALVSSAEVLTPAMRKTIEAVFHKPIYDRYGNREAGAIAAECEVHGGLHVNERDFIVEIDSPNPHVEPGPLLITYLANRAMPLLRYDTGDLALWAKGNCGCGRLTRRLARVVGRQSDMIRTASGNLVHGEYFTHVLYGAAGVRNFQFVQESLHTYRLLIEADKDPSTADVARWREKIMAVLGPHCTLSVERVAAIPALLSGKRKFTISKL